MVDIWKDIVEGSGLTWYRTILCDLLTGRHMRRSAADILDRALWYETQDIPFDTELDSAVRLEWIATRAERGEILWGSRLNRHGGRPESV